MWVLSTNRVVAAAVEPVVVLDPVGVLILVASDGYARALSLASCGDSWGTLVEYADQVGLHTLLAELLIAEFHAADTTGQLERSDDATAVLAWVPPESSRNRGRFTPASGWHVVKPVRCAYGRCLDVPPYRAISKGALTRCTTQLQDWATGIDGSGAG